MQSRVLTNVLTPNSESSTVLNASRACCTGVSFVEINDLHLLPQMMKTQLRRVKHLGHGYRLRVEQPVV